MSRRHHGGSAAGSSQTPEQEPLLGADDALVESGANTPKKYAAVDVLAVGAVDSDELESQCTAVSFYGEVPN